MTSYYEGKNLKDIVSLKQKVKELKVFYNNDSFACCSESDLQLAETCAERGNTYFFLLTILILSSAGVGTLLTAWA